MKRFRSLIFSFVMISVCSSAWAQETIMISNDWFEMQYPDDWVYNYSKIEDYHSCKFQRNSDLMSISIYPNALEAKATSDKMYETSLEMPEIQPSNKKISCRFNYLAYSFDFVENTNVNSFYGQAILMDAGEMLIQILLYFPNKSDLKTKCAVMEASFVLKYFTDGRKSGLPVKIGDSMYNVKDYFGEASNTGAAGASYSNLGLNFIQDEQVRVKKVHADYNKIKKNGWNGYIYGIKIGENIGKCISLWGEPSGTKQLYSTMKIYIWQVDGVTLEITSWAEEQEISGRGLVKEGEIKEISFY